MFEKATTDIPGLQKQFEKGQFGELKTWLNTNIHAQGRRYSPAELCKKVTGKPLTAEPFLKYLEGKIRAVYGV